MSINDGEAGMLDAGLQLPPARAGSLTAGPPELQPGDPYNDQVNQDQSWSGPARDTVDGARWRYPSVKGSVPDPLLPDGWPHARGGERGPTTPGGTVTGAPERSTSQRRRAPNGPPVLEPRRGSVDRLELASAAGVWVVSSASSTRYFLDVDAGVLLRQPGEGSATGPYDGVWVQLLKVSNLQETGVIQVGLRHRYDLDPDPGGPADFRWWVQRTATGIDRVAPEDRPVGRAPDPDEDWHHYWHPRAETAPLSTPPEEGDDGRA